MLVIKFLYHLVGTGIPVLVSISMDLVVVYAQIRQVLLLTYPSPIRGRFHMNSLRV